MNLTGQYFMKPLKTIEEELTDCRAALAGSKVGDLVWCCHHEVLAEVLR